MQSAGTSQSTRGQGKQPEHTDSARTHPTTTITSRINPLNHWEHRTYWHTHDHNHNALTHSHDHTQLHN